MTILTKSEDKYQPTKKLRSKTDLTTWRKAERSERELIMREKRSRTYKKPRSVNFKTLESMTNISTRSIRKPYRSDIND